MVLEAEEEVPTCWRRSSLSALAARKARLPYPTLAPLGPCTLPLTLKVVRFRFPISPDFTIYYIPISPSPRRWDVDTNRIMARTRSMEAGGVVNGNGHKSGGNGSIQSNSDTTAVKRPTLSARTDYTRWRLLDDRGRQTWHYLEDDEDVKKWPQSTADKYFLGLPLV